VLGYAEYGDPKGQPLFHFHGHPGSRLGAQLAHADAEREGVRIIAFDRPGYGLSDYQPRRKLLDWPDDVVEAADALEIERFAVVGASGGGPYALACAYEIPDRLTAVGIVSGFGPLDAPEATFGMRQQNRIAFRLTRFVPLVARAAMATMAGQAQRDPERVVAAIGGAMAEPDRIILSRPEVKKAFVAIVREAFRAGGRGPAWDMVAIARPWGFRLEDIAMEVHLWQGEEDLLVPPSMGRYQAQAIPNCRATFYPGEGHLLVVDHMREIQEALFSRGTP
jgi:pimeloyl-ACP methyl ester carboxylesterase